MKALDTNVIVRLLLNDDPAQGQQVKALLESAEADGERFLLSNPVILELLWVLRAVYDFNRNEILDALELLSQMPVFVFEHYPSLQELIRLGRTTRADLPDLLIGLTGLALGCEATLTFAAKTKLFERL